MKSNIEILLDSVDYKPVNFNVSEVESGLPHVTHEGTLNLGPISIQVLVLSTGERIIPESEIMRLLNPSPTVEMPQNTGGNAGEGVGEQQKQQPC